jgi:hypothetical protein
VPSIDELSQPVGGRKNFQIGVGAIREAAFGYRLGDPTHQQQPEHETARYDVE